MNNLSNFFSFFFPKLCLHCSSLLNEDLYICKNCAKYLPKTNFHKKPNNNMLFHEISYNVDINEAFSLYFLEDNSVLKTIIHKMKYNNFSNIGTYLGEIYADILKKETKLSYDIIIPIPLHKKKQNIRGYNQSDFIAKGLNKYFNSTIDNKSIIRIKNTKSQTYNNLYERKKNLANAFSLINKNNLENKKILIVDDIITTGATVIQCIKEIKKNIECEISVCSIGYAFNTHII